MSLLKKIHHVAIICSDYQRSKTFYTELLGLTVIREVYREERQSFKLDLALGGEYIIELFSFPEPPARCTGPEACGLRHLAFGVEDIDAVIHALRTMGVDAAPVMVDTYTGRKFAFFRDPDGLPLELYEV